MSEKDQAKKYIFQNTNGAEITSRMIAYFKKYTIPAMKTAAKNCNDNITMQEVSQIFDGKLPLYATK